MMAASPAVQQYEERVSKAADTPIHQLPQGLSQSLNNRILSFEWTRGRLPGSVIAMPTVEALQSPVSCHLRILLAPLNLPERPNSYPGFKALVGTYRIPDAFITERLHNVAYSFGSRISEDGPLQTLWMHLLMKDIPPNDNSGPLEERAWTRTAFYAQWGTCQSENGERNASITFICFGAVKHFRQYCLHLRNSETWEDILKDPYILVGRFLESWYERIDSIVWTANQRGSKLETQTVEETSAAALSNPRSDLRFEHLYRTVQVVIWLREGLEATLNAIELFIEHYREHVETAGEQPSTTHKNNVAEFVHRREMFRATQLRLVSLHQRLECIHNMIYALSSLRTQHTTHRTSVQTQALSTMMSRDSFKMATLALMGALFLPTSMVATITSAVYEHKQTAGGTVKSLGVLLAVSVPLTGLLMWAYIKAIKRPQSGRGLAGGGGL